MSNLKRVVEIAIAMLGGAVLHNQTVGSMTVREMQSIKELNEKYAEFYDLLLQWVRLHQDNNTIGGYLASKGYKKIAIYGMKELGELLLRELEESEVDVSYAIDRDADALFFPIEIYRPDEALKEVDAIIVTAIHYYSEIKILLEQNMNCPILSLYDIVYDI